MERATLPTMDEALVCRLAGLYGASCEAVEATIALWPLGVRLTLAALGIIDTSPDQDASNDFSLTDTGLEVITQCASLHGSHRRTGPGCTGPAKTAVVAAKYVADVHVYQH